MPDKKISELISYATVLDADLLPIVQVASSITKKVTVVDLFLGRVPLVATGAEINTGTNDTKFASAKAITDSDVAFLGDIPVKASGAEVVTGTNDAKFVTAKSLVDAGVTVPTGVVLPFAGTVTPTGFLLCYGQAVSRTTYAALFAVIDVAYGVGDTTTTFNVPDLRGRIPLGKDDMGGASANRVTDTDADTLGNADGSETHTLITAEIPSHTHTLQYNARSAAGVIAGGALVAKDAPDATLTSDSAGGGGAHNNMQPYQTHNYIIKI